MANQDTHKVNPFQVSGKIDYNKLIKEFGVKILKKEQLNFLENLAKQKKMKLHIFLKRNLFFSHRDFDKIIEDIENKKPIFLYTGRAPGGVMHIGHLIPFLFTKYLQDLFDCNLYIQIPDDEKFLFKKDLKLSEIDKMVESDLLDIASIGFDTDKTFIFKNREYIKQIYDLKLKVDKKITFSQVRNTFGFVNSSNVGQISYPSLQILPTFFEKNSRCLIPCAIDQNPYFMLQRDFAKKIGYKKNATILSKFLPPLSGVEGKMSSSENERAILLTDNKKIIIQKINKYAFSGGKKTLEEHKKFGGDTKIDISYQYLYYLFEESEEKINQIKIDYEKGILTSGGIKKLLSDKVVKLIEEHQKRKEKVKEENILDKYMYSGKLAKKMWKTNNF
jgi:tryptophanyl-tRNA synthetase